MEEKLLNIAEVAQYLNLSEEAVKELVEKGDLPAYKIGGVLLRFKKEQIENYRKRGDRRQGTDKERIWIDRSNALRSVEVKYTFLERLEDFLYYNDFYILSLVLLVLIILAVFGF